MQIKQKILNTELKEDELALWLKFIENPLNEEVQIKMKENKYIRQAKEGFGTQNEIKSHN